MLSLAECVSAKPLLNPHHSSGCTKSVSCQCENEGRNEGGNESENESGNEGGMRAEMRMGGRTGLREGDPN